MLKRNFCVFDSNTIVWKRTVFLHNAFYLSRDFCTRSVRDTFYTTRIFLCADRYRSHRDKQQEKQVMRMKFSMHFIRRQQMFQTKQKWNETTIFLTHSPSSSCCHFTLEHALPGMIPGTWYQGTVGPTCWCFCVWCIYVGPTTEYSALVVQYILKVFCVS